MDLSIFVHFCLFLSKLPQKTTSLFYKYYFNKKFMPEKNGRLNKTAGKKICLRK